MIHYNSFQDFLDAQNAGELKLEHYTDKPAIEVPKEEVEPLKVEVVEKKKEGKKSDESVEAD